MHKTPEGSHVFGMSEITYNIIFLSYTKRHIFGIVKVVGKWSLSQEIIIYFMRASTTPFPCCTQK